MRDSTTMPFCPFAWPSSLLLLLQGRGPGHGSSGPGAVLHRDELRGARAQCGKDLAGMVNERVQPRALELVKSPLLQGQALLVSAAACHSGHTVQNGAVPTSGRGGQGHNLLCIWEGAVALHGSSLA